MSTNPDAVTKYEQSLLAIRKEHSKDRMLSRFWSQPGAWPTGNASKVFLGGAVQALGSAKYQQDWTNEELGALRSTYYFPSFEGTLCAYLERWVGPKARAGKVPISAASSRILAQMKAGRFTRGCQQDVEDLAQEYGTFRPQYNDTVDSWNQFKEQNGRARDRLEWVITWLASKCRDREARTYLRRVDTAYQASDYIEAPAGFWETENLIADRFGAGRILFILPDAEKSSSDAGLESFYVFLEREDVERLVASLAPGRSTPRVSTMYRSDNMELIDEATDFFKLSRHNQPKLEELIAWFMDKRVRKGKVTRNMARAMGQVMRDSDLQLGRARKTDDDG